MGKLTISVVEVTFNVFTFHVGKRLSKDPSGSRKLKKQQYFGKQRFDFNQYWLSIKTVLIYKSFYTNSLAPAVYLYCIHFLYETL